jgi:hypothetical protein
VAAGPRTQAYLGVALPILAILGGRQGTEEALHGALLLLLLALLLPLLVVVVLLLLRLPAGSLCARIQPATRVALAAAARSREGLASGGNRQGLRRTERAEGLSACSS